MTATRRAAPPPLRRNRPLKRAHDVKAQSVVPERSDDPVTQRINAWAADTYPVAYAHLQAAKDLKDALKKRSTN